MPSMTFFNPISKFLEAFMAFAIYIFAHILHLLRSTYIAEFTHYKPTWKSAAPIIVPGRYYEQQYKKYGGLSTVNSD